MGPDTHAVDEVFGAWFAEGHTPGLVYGVVRDGELVHSGAFGVTRATEEETRPDADSVFRIASMSKSFIAAAVLLLRDRGALDLDEAVAQYVPELVDQSPYSTDSPAATLRQVLTMSGGLLSDNPWGDRQEALTYDAFGTFLDGGFTPGREPGVGFEYSNLGYALLGRVVANVVGGDAPDGADRDFVEHELLGRLGMTSTAYDAGSFGPRRVPGHVKRAGEWTELEATPPGAFSAMGGMHSTLSDLARWVGGFTAAFRDGADGHPLVKASRREMQQLHQLGGAVGTLALSGPEPGIGAVASGYGYGLMVDHDALLGQIVHHSGGYPGYGSRMVWHPETGLGVISLSNGTYAGAYDQAMLAARLLVRGEQQTRRGRLADRVEAALRAGVERLRTFDIEAEERFADPSLFADNVALDVPDDERRRELREARAKVGLPLAAGQEGYVSLGMAEALAVVPAERGRYDVEVLLSPEAEPRMQSIKATAVPDAPEPLLAAAREAVAADSPAAGVMRAFGDPALVARPVTCDGEETAEFLVVAGPTYWKLSVGPKGVVLKAHSTLAYRRLGYLARVLRTDRDS